MRLITPLSTLALAIALATTGCQDGDNGSNGADGQDASRTTIALDYQGNFRKAGSGFDVSAAEIVAFDPSTDRVFIVNAESGMLDIADLTSPANPTYVSSLDVAGDVDNAKGVTMGAVNSVSVHGGIIAAAIEADPKQDPGYVAFYQSSDLTFLGAVQVGALPDMLTFTPDGSRIVVANEGEPNSDYSVDPEGSISVIDMSPGAGALTQANVTSVGFSAFNSGGSRASEIDSKTRISAHSASVAQDLEPEYVAVSADSATAWVSLQENNAIVEVDLATASITSLWGLGYKDHGLIGNELDVSNKDDAINIRTWPLYGTYMPDSIAVYQYAGRTLVVTANEGDSRDYSGYIDEIRVRDIVDPGEQAATIDIPGSARFAGVGVDSDGDGIEDIFENENLGRLKVITNLGLKDANCLQGDGLPSSSCVYEGLYAFGGRSFSIFDADSHQLVYDSGSEFERITAQRLGADFNSDHTENGGDARSDDKGPEPEALTLATFAGRTYAFIGLERVGGVMVYDISEPQTSTFVEYLNPRNFSVDPETGGVYNAGAGDLGPEGFKVVSAADSPSGDPLLLVGNEVSGTTGIYRIERITLGE